MEFIPPRCTGLLQPVDVGFNKTFKAKLRTEYNSWLLEQNPDLPIPGTTRCDVSNWIIAAEKAVTNKTIKNSWRKTGYAYFGVFSPDGEEFIGDGAIVGNDPYDERDPDEPDSEVDDNTYEDAIDANKEGMG